MDSLAGRPIPARLFSALAPGRRWGEEGAKGEMDEIAIARAAPEDAEAILKLQKEAYQTEAALYGDWGIAPLTQTLEQLQSEFRTHVILKATRGQKILGSIRARQEGGAVQVGRLFVAEAARRQGIGGLLLRSIESAFPEARSFELFTGGKSEGNIRLYQGCGYAAAGERADSPKVTLVIMRKEAAPA